MNGASELLSEETAIWCLGKSSQWVVDASRATVTHKACQEATQVPKESSKNIRLNIWLQHLFPDFLSPWNSRQESGRGGGRSLALLLARSRLSLLQQGYSLMHCPAMERPRVGYHTLTCIRSRPLGCKILVFKPLSQIATRWQQIATAVPHTLPKKLPEHL